MRAPDIALFVTNLRLLDLDRRPDWPGITEQTFSTKDAQQNQKNRIRCVEWALFRLFELWDPVETRDASCALHSPSSVHQADEILFVEAAAILPAPRASPVPEPARSSLPLPQRAQEEWSLGQGVCAPQDDAG